MVMVEDQGGITRALRQKVESVERRLDTLGVPQPPVELVNDTATVDIHVVNHVSGEATPEEHPKTANCMRMLIQPTLEMRCFIRP